MATFLITACSNENDEELISTSTKGILSATVEGNHSSTRAGFASDGKFYWSKKDQLGVTTSQNASSFSALSLKNGIGTASGTFDGVINGTIGDYAVYPYYDNHSINDPIHIIKWMRITLLRFKVKATASIRPCGEKL